MARLRYLQNARTGTAGTINKSTYPLQFFDDDMYIYASADGVLEIVSDTTITLTAPTINLTTSTVSAFTYPVTITYACTSTNYSALTITSVSTSTSSSVVIKPLYVNATMSGTNGLGRAIEGKLLVSGKIGDYGNAIKGYTDLTGGTGCVGLVSAICAEMKMPATTALGTHAVLEIELVMPTSAVIQQGIGANCTSFIRARVSDNSTAVQSFNDYGYLFDLQGLTTGSADLFDGCTLKCAIGSTKYYLLLSTATASFTTAYPIVSTYGGEALSITSTLSGDTAINGVEMAFTAATTSSAMVSHGSSEGLYVYQNITGVKSGSSRTEALSVVQTVTGSGASIYAYAAHIHWHNAGNPAITNLTGLQIDMDNPGNAVSNMIGLDVYRDGANTGSCRDTFIRCANGGSGLPEAAFYLEGPQGTGVAEKLFIFSYCEGGSSFLVDGAIGGSSVKKIKVNVCDSPGTSGTDYYIPLYAS